MSEPLLGAGKGQCARHVNGCCIVLSKTPLTVGQHHYLFSFPFFPATLTVKSVMFTAHLAVVKLSWPSV